MNEHHKKLINLLQLLLEETNIPEGGEKEPGLSLGNQDLAILLAQAILLRYRLIPREEMGQDEEAEISGEKPGALFGEDEAVGPPPAGELWKYPTLPLPHITTFTYDATELRTLDVPGSIVTFVYESMEDNQRDPADD